MPTDLERFVATDGRTEAVQRVRAEIDAEGISYIYNRYKRVGDLAMDESFFPILWRNDGYRTPWLDGYMAGAASAKAAQ